MTSSVPFAVGQTNFPELYERWLVGPLFQPWAETIFDELSLTVGDRVLDIACGTGIIARLAKERLGAAGHVVGVDINRGMLAVARAAAPAVDWREGDAGDLPIRDNEQFDIVVCQQGLQFFPDKPKAIAQMRLALSRSGRLAVATWRSDEEIPIFRALRGIAERHLGPIEDRRHCLGDGARLEAMLKNAGCHDIRSRILSRMVHFEDGAPFLRLNTMALVGMSAASQTMDDGARQRLAEAIAHESAPVLQSFSNGARLAFELSTNLATARG